MPIRKAITAQPAADVFIYDVLNCKLYNVGGLREDSLKLPVSVFKENMHSGIPHQLGAGLSGECDLLETENTDMTVWDGAIGNGCNIWIVGEKETTVIKDIDFTLGIEGKFSFKGCNAVKLLFTKNSKKVTDTRWKMQGHFSPEGSILILNPALQRDFGKTFIPDISDTGAIGVWNGMDSSAWDADKKSLKFDGVNDYISFADSQLRGNEMIGLQNPNNRNFETGIGNWTTGASSTLQIRADGYSGNCLKLGIPQGPVLNVSASLNADIKDLIADKDYCLELWIRHRGIWGTLPVSITIDNYTTRVWPTNSWQRVYFNFTALGTNASLTILCHGDFEEQYELNIDEISLKTMSRTNMNGGERIYHAKNRSFEINNEGNNWFTSGNHSKSYGAGRGGENDYALRITSTGGGNQGTNHLWLPFSGAGNFYRGLSINKRYTLEFFAKIGTAGINITAAFSPAGQFKMFSNLSTTLWKKCVWNFIATEEDVNGVIRIFLSNAETIGTLIDDISLSEASDFTIAAWFKRSGITYIAEKGVSKISTTGVPGYSLGIKDYPGLFVAILRDDGNTVTLNSSISGDTNQYVCIVATFDRLGAIRVYGNGLLDGLQPSIGELGKIISPVDLLVGAAGGPIQYWKGNIGNVIIVRGEAWGQNKVLKFYNSTKDLYE